jgi:hypothetical protein
MTKKTPMRHKKPPAPDRGISREMTANYSREYSKVQSALVDYDRVASEMERKWGVDRLPELVDAELRERFWQTVHRLNVAIDKNDPDEVRRHADAAARGWYALERAAMAAGALPPSGEGYDARIDETRVLRVCRTIADATVSQRERPDVVAVSVEEIARIWKVWDERDIVATAKQLFPGSEILDAREKPDGKGALNDEIPF